MTYAAVHDVHSLDSSLGRGNGVLELRDHAAGDSSVVNESLEGRGGQLVDELLLLVKDASDIGEEKEPIGLQ